MNSKSKENNSPERVASITFVATSNKVQATATKNEVNLREAIQKSATYSKVFAETEPKDAAMKKRMPFAERPTKPKDATIIQSSEVTADDGALVRTAKYGLVSAIMDAYNRHHCLVLRPDDVWQAILTQFSFYVNANAEALRDSFVDFKGKKTLVVTMGGTLFSANFASFANRMVDEQIATNLKDKSVTDWLLPAFSTTRSSDRVAASVTIMSTLQSYFEYVCYLMCGIPKVTLEGPPEDWKSLRTKIDRLPQYDIPSSKSVMKQWHALLAPVLDQFVLSAQGKPDLAFWDTVCSHEGGGSGPSYLSGWVTVFACFKTDGTWQGGDFSGRGKPKWPFIETGSLPVGTVSVPVLVDDNGTQYDTQMLAGQFAYEMTGDNKNNLDTVRPRTDWCIAYEGAAKKKPRHYKHGEIRTEF